MKAGQTRSGRPASDPSGAGFLLAALATGVVGLAGLSLIAAAPAPLYRDGPPPGFSGGFGEQSCHACHFTGDVNEAPGRLTVEGVPEAYQAGESYPLVITLTRPEMALGGFQLSARFEDDGTQAGELAPAAGEEARVQVSVDRDVQYAYQADAGSTPASPDTLRWSVVWTAPDGDGTVVFSAAGNAADGDETAEGDYVYTASITSPPEHP